MTRSTRGIVRAAAHLTPIAVIVFAALEWNGIPGQARRDTFAYYTAAAAARADRPLYPDPSLPASPHEFTGEWPYLYPPPLAALLSFLPESSYRTFDRGWLVLNVLAFWILAGSLGKIATGAWSLGPGLRWGAALFFFPGTLLAMHFGNVEVLLLALVGVGLAATSISGFTVSLAAALKVTPVWPLLTLALRWPGRALPGVAAAVLVAGGACAAALGTAGTAHLVHEWVTTVLPSLGQGQFWGESLHRLRQGSLPPHQYFGNLSLSFLPVQLAVISGWWDYEGGGLPGPVRLYLLFVSVGAPVLAAWLSRHLDPRVQATVVLAVAMLSAPIVRPYALPVFLLVLAAIRGSGLSTRRQSCSTAEQKSLHPPGVRAIFRAPAAPPLPD